jgi:hypothetical protein
MDSRAFLDWLPSGFTDRCLCNWIIERQDAKRMVSEFIIHLKLDHEFCAVAELSNIKKTDENPICRTIFFL